MNRLRFHSEAEFELWEAVSFYEARVSGLGLNFIDEITRCLITIGENPKSGTKARHDTRRRLLSKFPYFIYYLECKTEIWIVAVAHTSRRPFYWRRRKPTIA